jgi:hypothetical protein
VKRTSVGILVVTVFDWHCVILDPLVQRFREWRDVDYISIEAIVGGWRPAQVPQLIVVCDAGVVRLLRDVFPTSLFMHVGHGLISKNQTSYHYCEPDFVCVASQAIANRLTALQHKPRRRFFATGLIQTDPLFRSNQTRSASGANTKRATVVYAPTWNESLTSVAMFGSQLIQKIRGDDEDINIVIKPHPHIAVVRPEWIEMWTQMTRDNHNVRLCDAHSDLIPVLLESDLMVSDASSAIFHFLALNRPIVLVNNAHRFDDVGAYDPNGIEWQWRDIANEVDDVNAVRSVVKSALRQPMINQEQRLRRRYEMFGGLTDGRSLERIHSAALHVVDEYL